MSRKLVVAVLSALCAGTLTACLILTDALEPFEPVAIDLFNHFRPRKKPPQEIVLIALDDHRLNLSLLLEALSQQPPKTTVILSKLDTLSRDQSAFDYILAERIGLLPAVVVVAQTVPVISDSSIQAWIKSPSSFGNISGVTVDIPEVKVISQPHTSFSSFASVATFCPGDELKIPLVYRHGTRFLAGLPLVVLLRADGMAEPMANVRIGKSISWTTSQLQRFIPLQLDGTLRLNPRYQIADFTIQSLDSVLRSVATTEGTDEKRPLEFKDKIVFIYPPGGATEKDLAPVLGAISNILQNDFLERSSAWLSYGISFLFLFAASLSVTFSGLQGRIASLLIAAIAAVLLALKLFLFNILWPVESLLLGLLMLYPWIRLFEAIFVTANTDVQPSIPHPEQTAI